MNREGDLIVLFVLNWLLLVDIPRYANFEKLVLGRLVKKNKRNFLKQ